VRESNSLNTLKIHVAWILKTESTDVNSDYWPCAVFKVHRGAPTGSPWEVSQN